MEDGIRGEISMKPILLKRRLNASAPSGLVYIGQRVDQWSVCRKVR